MGKKFALVYLIVLTLVMGGANRIPRTPTSRHDGLPRHVVPRNDRGVVVAQHIRLPQNRVRCHRLALSLTLVIASLKGVAIHCEPVSEPHCPNVYPETRWIAASD